MLKDYLSENKTSVYKLAKAINEPYSTLNDLSNGRYDIDECKVKLLKKTSEYFKISLEEMYIICKKTDEVENKVVNMEVPRGPKL